MASFVGMSLGVLLPTLFPGLCFGVNLALIIGVFLNGLSMNALYFPVVGGLLATVGAYLSIR
jgi:callose synthase